MKHNVAFISVGSEYQPKWFYDWLMVTQENYHVGTSQLFVFSCCVVLFCLVWGVFLGWDVFVCLWIFLPLENCSLIWRSHHYRWRAANFYILSFFKQRDTSVQRSENFTRRSYNKANDWIFNLNDICISNKNRTIQWPIAFCVCRARFCSKQNTHFYSEDSA